MTDPGRSVPRSVAKGRLFNATAKRRTPSRSTPRSAPEVVIWRAKPCNCRVLAVYLDPGGWHLAGDRFRVSLEEQLARLREAGLTEVPISDDGTTVELTLENYRAGMFRSFTARRVSGVQHSQPLDFADWRDLSARFEVGCDHGRGLRPMADVLEDCRAFRASRKREDRPIYW